MSVKDPSVGEDFSARVIMKQDGVVPIRWGNTWELSTNVGTTFTDWQTFADALAAFHKAMLVPSYQVERVVISTLAADSAPYNPDNVAVFEYDEFGTRAADSDIYRLETCLHIKREVEYGRHGDLLLRGFLCESDVHSFAGGTIRLTDRTATQATVASALSTSGLGGYLAGSAINIQLYMITKGLVDNTERSITGLSVAGLSNKKLRNKYFDRG